MCKHRPEDEITVIQLCAWPVTSSKEDQNFVNFKLPNDLKMFTQCFKTFYEEKHNGRVLNYAYAVSTCKFTSPCRYVVFLADIQINIGSKSTIITMTIPQSVILMAYNDKDRATIASLAEELGLTFEYVCSCLKSLLELKLLKSETTSVSLEVCEFF